MAGHNRRNDWHPWFRQPAGWHREPKLIAADKKFGNKNPTYIYGLLQSLACERQWNCTNSGSYGSVLARDIMHEARGVRRLGAILAEFVLRGLLTYDERTDEYLIGDWAKYNPMPAATPGQRQVHNDTPRSGGDDDEPAPRTRVGERAPVRAQAPTATRLRETKRRTELLKEQSSSVQELSRVAPAAAPPPPPGGGAAEAEAPPQPLGHESKDQEQEPAPKLTQAQRNPRLVGVDGADEIVPDWRELADRQVSTPEHVSTVMAGIRDMLGGRASRRKERERENLTDETLEARRQAQMRALEAMDPACKIESPQSQNGEIHL